MEKPTTSFKTLLIVLLLMLLTLGLTSYFLYQKQQDVIGLNAQKSALITRLADMIKQNNATEAENDSIKIILDANRNDIVSMIDTIARMSNLDDISTAKFEGSINRIENENQRLLAQVDSLKSHNKQLQQEKEVALFSLRQAEATNDSLSEAVKSALPLRIDGLNTVALNMKRRGDIPTTSAWRAEKIKSCFTVPANKLAQKGIRTIFLRILDEENRVLRPNGSLQPDTSSTKIFYSARQVINFKGEAVKSCMEYEYDDFDDGFYTIELYIDGAKRAEQKLLLD
jgi:cell division protein FtsB